MGLTSEQAREMARKSVEARRQHPTTWPRLDSVEHMKVRLEICSTLGLKGAMSASMVGAQERVLRTWLEGYLADKGIRRLRELETRVQELEAENAQMRARAGRRGVA